MAKTYIQILTALFWIHPYLVLFWFYFNLILILQKYFLTVLLKLIHLYKDIGHVNEAFKTSVCFLTAVILSHPLLLRIDFWIPQVNIPIYQACYDFSLHLYYYSSLLHFLPIISVLTYQIRLLLNLITNHVYKSLLPLPSMAFYCLLIVLLSRTLFSINTAPIHVLTLACSYFK